MAMRMERFRPEYVDQATRGVSAPIRDIILRALRRDPTERFQSGLQLRDALWDFLGGQGRCYGPRDVQQEVSLVRAEAIRRNGGAQLPEDDYPSTPPGGTPRKPGS
jgi:serine/threonine-protein kinase